MRVWLDLANSPHPLLFAPVARRLAGMGAEIHVTARDHAQTAELTLERWPEATVLGARSPGGRLAKAGSVASRVLALMRWARGKRPDVALSHNSYGQVVAARALGIPAVTAMDFEYQPANHVAFRCASRVLLPEAMPHAAARRCGATARKTVRYPGLKEELYLGDFVPDPGVLNKVGVERQDGVAVVVLRTAPVGATYHRNENPLLEGTLHCLATQSHVRSIVLARHPDQRRQIKALGLPNCWLPERAVDARSLMHEADLFVGAGGTMTREAALLGVPTFSVFAGRRPAVDLVLEKDGALRVLRAPQDLGRVRLRDRDPADLVRLRERGRRIEEIFATATMALVQGRDSR